MLTFAFIWFKEKFSEWSNVMFPFWNVEIRIFFPAQGENTESKILPRYDHRGENGLEEVRVMSFPSTPSSAAPLLGRPPLALCVHALSHSVNTCTCARPWGTICYFYFTSSRYEIMFSLMKQTKCIPPVVSLADGTSHTVTDWFRVIVAMETENRKTADHPLGNSSFMCWKKQNFIKSFKNLQAKSRSLA